MNLNDQNIIVEIMYNNKIEKIEKFIFESNTRFMKRLDLIKIMEKDKIILKDAIKFSKIWYNVMYNNCKYNTILYQTIIKYNKLLK